MGVKKLFTFLNNNNMFKVYPYLNDLLADLNLDKKKLLVGVDGNLFCHKYAHSYDNMLIGFFNQVLKFLSNKIIPLYIFDGGTFQEKENTNYVRYQKKMISKYKLEQIENLLELNESNDDKNNLDLIVLKKKMEKNSIKINIENITLLLELFDLLNIPYIFSHGEGEYLAVLLNKYNIIDMFLSDDTDPIPAGINRIIKFYNNGVYYLDTKLIYDKFNLTYTQFCDFCILLGNDYSSFNHGLKPDELFNLIKKYHTIENIYLNNKINSIDENSFELINKIRNIYYYSDVHEQNFITNRNNNTKLNESENIDNLLVPNTKIIHHDMTSHVNLLIDHNNMSYYSNIMLEYWDEFVEVLEQRQDTHININDFEKKEDNYFENENDDDNGDNENILNKSENFKFLINTHVSKSKFCIKKIIKQISLLFLFVFF